MPVPTYDKFIEPILRFLAQHPEGVPARDAHDAAAAALGLTEEERQELIPTGQAAYKNRSGWAHDRLKRIGYSSSPKHGFWRVTAEGAAFVATHVAPLTEKEVERIAKSYMPGQALNVHNSDSTASADAHHESAVLSPDDRLQSALSEIQASVRSELLELLLQVSPKYFETVVLDVLHRLGYGASRSDLQRVGGSGDAGIDGVISLDRLGLEKVYVQAKRWKGVVGRPEIQGFYGALAGQRATKGVFITTSVFTAQAVDFARSVERIVLVDGTTLAQLMIDCEVGVTSQHVRVPKIDSDYFDE